MIKFDQLYIDGKWVNSESDEKILVVNPATEEVCAQVPSANHQDIDKAIDAARYAFDSWSQISAEQRKAFILAAADELQNCVDELEDAITQTMGCPKMFCNEIQVQGSIDSFREFAEQTEYVEEFEEERGTLQVKDAIGVCVLINPWNYPLSQLVGKIGPALATGCTVVVKPAEQTPIQDYILAKVFEKIGLPAGVFNLVSGRGSQIGERLCSHPEVDMVSFTGSTGAGIKVAQAASSTVKRVCQELGGKSAYIITEDADLEAAVRYGVEDVMINSGQTCTALTRMLVPNSLYEQAQKIAKSIAEENAVGNPLDANVSMGPLSSLAQKETVVNYINKGIAEGAKLITGGPEMPQGLSKGAYVKPTIFADVNNQMSIAREEIFGPVLVMLPYDDIDDAVSIANDSIYGLSSGVYAKEKSQAIAIARRLKAGQCYIQGSYFNTFSAFGGYKQSGNGREWGREGLKEYVELKSIITE